MVQVCPINERKVNEKVVRSNAFLTLGLLLIFVLRPEILLLIIIAVDFLLRVLFEGKYSFLSKISKFVTRSLEMKANYINAGPKVFAAKIGLILTLASGLLLMLGIVKIALIIAGLIIFFAFLEGAFGICIACKLYPFYNKYIFKKGNC